MNKPTEYAHNKRFVTHFTFHCNKKKKRQKKNVTKFQQFQIREFPADGWHRRLKSMHSTLMLTYETRNRKRNFNKKANLDFCYIPFHICHIVPSASHTRRHQQIKLRKFWQRKCIFYWTTRKYFWFVRDRENVNKLGKKERNWHVSSVQFWC